MSIFVYVLLATAFGQSRPVAVVSTELDHPGCEDLSGRLDTFFHELNADPTAVGYVVISTVGNKRLLSSLHRFIDGYPRYRGFDEKRLVLVGGNLPASKLMEFWLVPQGAEFLEERTSEIRYEIEKSVRKKMVYSDYNDFGPCYTGPPLRILSKYLKTDGELTANIAVGTTTAKKFSELKKGIIESFEKDYGVDPSRLRFFRTKTLYDNVTYELWLLRRKRK